MRARALKLKWCAAWGSPFENLFVPCLWVLENQSQRACTLLLCGFLLPFVSSVVSCVAFETLQQALTNAFEHSLLAVSSVISTFLSVLYSLRSTLASHVFHKVMLYIIIRALGSTESNV
ncbi:hypothetical protein C8F01DRAFT_1119191 [Mycena amicta]|nr:hypothetical protein C8F01DRAFT_1119191 [Mycena amicta]